MNGSNLKTIRLRPMPTRREVENIDSESGDHIFRFPLVAKDAPTDPEKLYRWVIEEQLRALLGVIELADNSGKRLITRYRFINEEAFVDLFPE